MANKDYIIEKFVDNFKGMACIRSIYLDKTLYENIECSNFSSIEDGNLSIAVKKSNSTEEAIGISFCMFVEEQFKKNLEPTFAIEIFNGVKYVTIRTLIDYQSQACMLTLICLSDDKEALLNDVCSCKVNSHVLSNMTE